MQGCDEGRAHRLAAVHFLIAAQIVDELPRAVQREADYRTEEGRISACSVPLCRRRKALYRVDIEERSERAADEGCIERAFERDHAECSRKAI